MPDIAGFYRARSRSEPVPDSIPLSDQAVHHLSPGCLCDWASFPADGTVGITQRHQECKVHPADEGKADA